MGGKLRDYCTDVGRRKSEGHGEKRRGNPPLAKRPVTESSGGRGTSDEGNGRVSRNGGGNWKGWLKIHPCRAHAPRVLHCIPPRLSTLTYSFSLPRTRFLFFLVSPPSHTSHRFAVARPFSLFIFLRRRTGFLRPAACLYYCPLFLRNAVNRNTAK